MKTAYQSIACLVFVIVISISTLGASPKEPMNDGKIVGISLTTDKVQIQGSKFAYPRIEYFDLKNFSNAMLVDYQNYQQAIFDFSQRAGVPPEESEAATEIQARGKKVLEELSQLRGRKLEKRYIDAQVELHEKTLDSIENVFLPNITNVELRNLVNNIRPAIQGRLEWALRIQSYYGVEKVSR